MPLVQQNLRSQVLRRTAQRKRTSLHNLGKTEVGQLQVAVVPDQQVLRLQVAEDDVLVVQVLENQHDLCCVQPNLTQRYEAW